MKAEVDCAVVGAGVIGLAVARHLAMTGRSVVILEREQRFGSGTSSRNSEVIHAGIYYQTASIKAATCVAGRQALYAYCISRGIPHRQCGKLIVATEAAQLVRLEALAAQARINGVDDVCLLEAAEVKKREPEVRAVAALASPSSGILDAHAYMLSLLGDAEAHGAVIAYGASVTALTAGAHGVAVTTGADDSPALTARWLVNAAGLDAHRVAGCIRGFPAAFVPTVRFAKGSYFVLSGRAPCQQLVYPLPEPGGLGIHLTLDVAGSARFGPDVEWIDEPEYHVAPEKAPRFAAAIRRYLPDLSPERLQPGYAAVRPKLSMPGAPDADFDLSGPAAHGVPGIFNLFGIESPGLTASLALAERVATAIQADG